MNLEVLARRPDGPAQPVPLLFIHGAYHSARCWEQFQSYFAARGYTSYAMSLRGHGASDGRASLRWSSANDYVDDVTRVVGRLPNPPVLIGHSMGGYLIQKYLEQHAVPGAVLLAPMPSRGGVRIFNRMLRHRPWRTLRMHLTMQAFVQVETPELAREYLFSPDIPAERLNIYYAGLQPESYRIGWDMSFFNVPRPIRCAKVPLLILGAEQDAVILPREVEATAADYGTKAEFFAMAHDMMLEAAWSRVAERIHGWFRSKGLCNKQSS